MKALVWALAALLLIGAAAAQENLTQVRIFGSPDSALVLSEANAADSFDIYYPTWRGGDNANAYVKGVTQFLLELDSLSGAAPDSFDVWVRELHKNRAGTYSLDYTDSVLLVDNGNVVETGQAIVDYQGGRIYTLKIPADSLFGPCPGFRIYGEYNSDRVDTMHVYVWGITQ